jgi:hypothetical protein
MPWWDPANFSKDKKQDGKTGFLGFLADPLNLAGRKDAAAPGPDFFHSDTFKTMQDLRPGFNSLTQNVTTGQGKDKVTTTALRPEYMLNTPDSNMSAFEQMLNGLNVDTRGLEALRGEGLRAPGSESAWATLAKQAQGLEEQKQLDTAARTGASQEASAFSNLARRGGVSSGARERIASGGALAQLRGRQEIAGQGAQARATIGLQDEGNRLDILKALPGLEAAAVQPGIQKAGLWSQLAQQESNQKFDANRFNTTNLIGERDKKADYDMGKYAEQMKAWAADRTATAQENSGKK